jgi:tetratricopeptide (TPR) repeat protein
MRPINDLLPATLLLCLSVIAARANADELTQQLLPIQQQWAFINYQLPESKKEEAFTALEEKAQALAERHADRAEPKLWQAIILSTHAGVRGGLGALGMVKKARELLLQAEAIDAEVMDGSIYTSLGSLYYQVPGWPLGFGDDDKARSLLLEALQRNPDGIDPNYFYGDFLYRNGETEAALAALNKALQAPARPDRPLADAGRREEVRALIAKIQTNG